MIIFAIYSSISPNTMTPETYKYKRKMEKVFQNIFKINFFKNSLLIPEHEFIPNFFFFHVKNINVKVDEKKVCQKF